MREERAARLGGTLVLALVAGACSFADLSGFSSPPDEPTDAGSDRAPPAGDASFADSGDAGATPADPYGDAVRADGPVAWYRFEDPDDANTAQDEVGGRSALLTAGNVGFGSGGISGKGLEPDGTALFEVGDVFDFAGKVPFSLELWVKPSPDGTDRRLIYKRKEVTGQLSGWILYMNSSDGLKFEHWGTQLSAWSDGPLPEEWKHVVLVVSYAGGVGNAKLYIDGQPQAQGGFDNTADAPDTDQPLRFLQRFKGGVDELAIYDKALPPDRILAHKRAGKP